MTKSEEKKLMKNFITTTFYEIIKGKQKEIEKDEKDIRKAQNLYKDLIKKEEEK